MRILFACGALAAGEFAAAQVSCCAEAWPAVACVAVLVALFGYGGGFRGWHIPVLFLVGIALYFLVSVEREQGYRERPWMRNWDRAHQSRSASDGRASSVRRDFCRRCALGLERDWEVAALNRAILFGDRTRLPARTKRMFVESGTMHVFAISGLHVMAVARVLALVMAVLFVPRRFCGVIALPFLWGYVGVIGWPPSAVRAAAMSTFCSAAPLFWRRPDLLQAWALTFLLVHVANPLLIVDVGCALSFAVMLALILAGRFARACGVRHPSVVATVAAWAVGVPIAAHVFGRVTPGGILANLVLIDTAFYSVTAGVIGVLSSFVSETLAAHLNNFSALVTKAMVGVAAAVSKLPGTNLEVGQWSLLQCAGWYLLLGLAVLVIRLCRNRKSAL